MDTTVKPTCRLCVQMPLPLRAALDELCRAQDTTASQVVRQLLRRYVDSRGDLLGQEPRARR